MSRAKITKWRTRRQALEVCRRLWTWLAETGSPAKSMWPPYENDEYDHVSECPVCDYNSQSHGRKRDVWGLISIDCSQCIMADQWKKTKGAMDCCDPGTPFIRWCDAKSERTRKKWAKVMVSRIDDALCKLDVEKVKRQKKQARAKAKVR